MRARVLTGDGDPATLAPALAEAWRRGELVGLAAAQEREALGRVLAAAAPGDLHGFGPGVVVGSGGSSGRRRWCVQPLAHLRASAAATGLWLESEAIDPATCLHLVALPVHHVSGLLPLVRCGLWGAELRWLPAARLRDPARLGEVCPLPPGRPVLLSLVPTQLVRLLEDPGGVAWLAAMAVIWVGGAPLPPELAERARHAGLPLAPCYGATETAAMVCALPPRRFLAGEGGCGPPLADVELRLDPAGGAVEARCPRLSPGCLGAGGFEPLPLAAGGWWRSGDGGRFGPAGGLEVLGRLDGALHSGGETVFPEQLEARLRRQAAALELPLAAVLLLGEPDPLWGERLVALVRPLAGADAEPLLERLAALTAAWPPAERPRRWCSCPALAPSAAGKWERGRWRRWLARNEGTAPGAASKDVRFVPDS